MTGSMDFWVKRWRADSTLAGVLESKVMQRLKDISFLGAIDYTPLTAHADDGERSRWVHSLSVAAITDFVAETRGYDGDTRRHLVAAALLHDIGHAPLSHSVEPIFKEYLGLGHHDLGMHFIDEDEELASRLSRHFDVTMIKALIAGTADDQCGGDLFSNPIHVDTIDGILRSAKRFGYNVGLDPFTVASAAFLDGDHEQSRNVLDEFWCLKDEIYNKYIVSRTGVLADSFSQYYFETTATALTHENLRGTERIWQGVFPDLFDTLASLSGQEQPLPDVFSRTYISRKYFIAEPESSIFKRYQVKKKRRA